MIRCELYDYLEMACLFGYRVRLNLSHGQQLTGLPVTLKAQQGEECLSFIAGDAPGEPMDIRLSELRSMTVLTPSARFEHVDFLVD